MDLHKHNEYLSKKNTELEKEINNLFATIEEYRQSHARFINNLSLAYSILKIIYNDKNQAVDFYFLDINNSFEKLTGIPRNDLAGEKISHILPGLLNDKFDWITFLGGIAQKDQTVKQEIYSEWFDKWFMISAYCSGENSVSMFLDDISKIKIHERKMQLGEQKLMGKNQEIASKNEAYQYLNDGYHEINTDLKNNNLSLQQIINSLKESENKYQLLFESSSEGFFIMTDVVYDCNAQVCEIFGYSKKELIGKHPTELSPAYQPDGRKSEESANEKIQAALNGENQYFYWKHKRKDNTLIDTEISLKATKIEGDNYIIATIKDISSKVKNEQKLKENERKLNEVYQIAKIGSWQLDTENREITLSKEHQLLIGIDSLSALPISMSLFEYADKYIVSEDISVLLHHFQIATNFSESIPVPDAFEYRLKHISGEIRYMEVHAKFFEKGVIYGITQDITERKLTQHKLTTTDFLLKGINQASGILLVENNFNNAIHESLGIIGRTSGLSRISIYMNSSDEYGRNYFNQKFEWSEAKYIIDNIVYKNLYYSDNGIERWFEILQSGEVIKGTIKDLPYKEQLFLEKAGVLSMLMVPIFIENKFWGFIEFDDISKFREWTNSEENILCNFSNSIGGVISTQARNDEIISAKEKAQESDRLKTSFLANMSHEIRTPMNAILGFTDLLKDESLSKHSRNEFIDIISSRGKDLLQIINDIIDISKIEAGQIKINPIECPLNIVLFELYNFFESNITLQDKKDVILKLRSFLPNDKCFVFIDAVRLKQIFVNLIGNAIKFTTKGYIEFGYKIEDNMIHFYVEDSGIGIPKEKQELIFDRFRQADDSITKNFGGTGLGLAISKSLTELMGGYMQLESEAEGGSKFSFILPYKPVQIQKAEEVKTPKDFTVETNWEDKLILIVEDDNVNFQYLKVILRKTKAKILRAENGVEAVELCKQNKDINIVLMDIQMPVMNGLEATRQIKEIRKNLPIIAQTAYAMSEDKEKCIAAGCDDYLSKPIDVKLLISVAGRYFKN